MDEYGDYLLDRDSDPVGYDPSEAWWDQVHDFYYEEHKYFKMEPFFEWEELSQRQKDSIAYKYKRYLEDCEKAYD